ncbi:hypothetical protein Tco_1536128, partial [Tanacetum coccineum]
LKVDKKWKEKFFNHANNVRLEEPKKARENTDATNKESVNTVKPSRKTVRVPRAVLMGTGLKTVKSAKPLSTVRSVNTVRPVSTARPNVNTVRARGFNVVKPSACWVWRPKSSNEMIPCTMKGGTWVTWSLRGLSPSD